MDMVVVSDFISSVGFPIAACAAMFYMNYREGKLHKDEVDTLRVTVERNTLVLQKLLDKINGVNGKE